MLEYEPSAFRLKDSRYERVRLEMINHNYKRLEIWKRSMKFVTRCYEITASFPKEEKYGLTDQIRRAAISINLNIAEGTGASSDVEFIRFLQIARRSSYEVSAGFEIAEKLNLIDLKMLQIINKESEEIGAMISGLIKSLRSGLKSNSLKSRI